MDRSFFVSRWCLCRTRHRCVDCSNHGLGLMEVSRFRSPLHRRLCVTVLRSSFLLRPPTYALQSSSSATRSTRSACCCELVVRPEWRFRSDLCFSCLRLGLIRHRRILRSSHLSSQVCHDSHLVTLVFIVVSWLPSVTLSEEWVENVSMCEEVALHPTSSATPYTLHPTPSPHHLITLAPRFKLPVQTEFQLVLCTVSTFELRSRICLLIGFIRATETLKKNWNCSLP